MKTASAIIVNLVLALFGCAAHAADIYPYNYSTGSLRYVVIEGRIEVGDFDKFIRIVKEGLGQVRTVAIFSAGGDFEEGIKIGRALRALEMSSMVPSRDNRGAPQCGFTDVIPSPKDARNCTAASAAFFIHIGAVMRSGLYMIVHRPHYSSRAFGQLSEKDGRSAFDSLQESSRAYMEEMGVPRRVQEDVLGTASDNGLVLDDTTVRTHFLGELPYYHEWMRNKCAKLDDDEIKRSAQYNARLATNRGIGKLVLNTDELLDLRGLQVKEDQERECKITASKARALEAYEKYFGVKPNDTIGYAFKAWPDQLKYLGRKLDDILAEERMTEEKSIGTRLLKRKAVGSAPFVMIFDSARYPDTASRLSVLSQPNPSQEFNAKLILALESAWGKALLDTGAEKTWRTNTHSATLKTNMKSGEGTSTVLHINAR